MWHEHNACQKTLDKSVLVPFVFEDEVAREKTFQLGEMLVTLVPLLVTDSYQHELELVELADGLDRLHLSVLGLGLLRFGCSRVFHNILEFNCLKL